MPNDLKPLNDPLKHHLNPYLAKINRLFNPRNIDDFVAVGVLGKGNAASTNRIYKMSIRLFLEFIEYKTPLQWFPGDLEAWYDSMVSRGIDLNTIHNRFSALKGLCKNIKDMASFWDNPFEIMDEKLKRKLFKKKSTSGTLSALTEKELHGVLDMLLEPNTLSRLHSHAIIYFLVTSGLRASEALSLRWRDIEMIDEDDGTTRVYCSFTGKGSVESRLELFLPAVSTLGAFHFSVFGSVEKDKHLFVDRSGNPMQYPSLYMRLNRIGHEAKSKNIIRQNIRFSSHLFRRTFITLLFKRGLDVKSIQKLSRHKVIDVLFKHYIDVSEPASPILSQIFGTDDER